MGIDYGALVRLIDPSLEFVEHIGYTPRAVCRVKKDDSSCVLKALNINYFKARETMNRERETLLRAAGVSGITHLVQDYGVVGEYEAILKEYAEGKDLHSLKEPLDSRLEFQLKETIRGLHSVGIACIRLCDVDIVVSPDRSSATILELYSFLSKEEISASQFEEFRTRDLENFEILNVDSLSKD